MNKKDFRVVQMTKNLLQCRRPGSIPGLERSPGGGHGNPLQYSDLENSVNCIVCGVTKSQTRSNFHFNIRLIGQFSSRSLMISSLTVKS